MSCLSVEYITGMATTQEDLFLRVCERPHVDNAPADQMRHFRSSRDIFYKYLSVRNNCNSFNEVQ